MSDGADAVRAHYVAAVTRRMQAAPDAVQRLLQARLAHSPSWPARAEPVEGLARPLQTPRSLHARPAAVTPLGELIQHMATAYQPGSPRPELRSAQAFRDTWSRICAEDDVAQAVQRGPENAGPLNSHMLVLRTLGLLRELSPDYLQRFMAQADTLLWLEQASGRLKPVGVKAKPARAKK